MDTFAALNGHNLVEGDPFGTGAGQCDSGEVPFGHREEFGELAVRLKQSCFSAGGLLRQWHSA
jgi:hypothetical protein